MHYSDSEVLANGLTMIPLLGGGLILLYRLRIREEKLETVTGIDKSHSSKAIEKENNYQTQSRSTAQSISPFKAANEASINANKIVTSNIKEQEASNTKQDLTLKESKNVLEEDTNKSQSKENEELLRIKVEKIEAEAALQKTLSPPRAKGNQPKTIHKDSPSNRSDRENNPSLNKWQISSILLLILGGFLLVSQTNQQEAEELNKNTLIHTNKEYYSS